MQSGQNHPVDWEQKVRELEIAVAKKTTALEREMKIEAALERIRSRSGDMRKSEEITDIAGRIFSELRQLDLALNRVLIWIFNDDEKYTTWWSANPEFDGSVESFRINYNSNPVFINYLEAWQQKQSVHLFTLSGQAKKNWEDFLFKQTELSRLPTPVKEGMRSEETLYTVSVISDYGIMMSGSLEPLSEENINIIQRFGRVFQQSYKRCQDVQKAEAQAREAQIEAALERIRAKALAMHNSRELTEVAKVLREQMELLGQRELETSAVHLYEEDAGNILSWRAFRLSSDLEGKINYGFFRIPKHSCEIAREFVQKFESSETDYTIGISGARQQEWYKVLFELAPEVHAAMKQSGTTREKRYYHFSKFSGGALLLVSSKEPSIDSLELQKRAAQVFDLAYRRFKDLQKAEAQAREAEIQLALERVRTRSLAMHATDELQDVVNVVAQQLMLMGIDMDGGVFIAINDELAQDFPIWAAAGAADYVQKVTIPFLDRPAFTNLHHAIKTRLPFYTEFYTREEKNEFLKHLFSHHPWNRNSEERKAELLARDGGYARSVVVNRHTSIGITNHHGKKFSEEDNDVLRRFGAVLEQSYTRFLDLQQAEKQVREAQIEAGLERVRARTMAMHSSSELIATAELLFNELRLLGAQSAGVAFAICEHDNILVKKWTSIGVFSVPYTYESGEQRMYEAWMNKEDIYEEVYEGGRLRKYLELFMEIPEFRAGFQKYLDSGIPFPEWQKNHAIPFKYGYLLLITYQPFEETHIFIRFAKVFEQTYTRFLDLQKAETQAREARIETALERVRAQAMAMHHSEDLGKTIRTYFEQLDSLIDSTVVRCGAGLLNKENTIADMSTASKNAQGETYDVKGSIDMKGHPLLENTYHHWLEQKEYSHILRGNEIRDYYQYITNQVAIPENKGEDQLYFYFPMFSEGSFYLVTDKELPEHELQVFRRFSSVLSLTYRRFNDLQKAEAQAREARIEGALEKVRSRSLAMQSPDELIEVAQLLREEMGTLGVEALETSSIYIHDESSGQTQCWFTIKDTNEPGRAVSDQMILNLEETRVGRKMLEFYNSQTNQTSILMQGDERKEWIRYCEAKTSLFGTSNFYGETIPERTYHLYRFSNGFIGAAAPGQISSESWELLKRATAVFSFAYTRFRDLQNAEASARAALRQASLDRVRADISSMRSATDLDRITPLVWNELTVLGIPFIRCGVFMVDEKKETVSVHLSSPDGRALAVMNLAFDSNELTTRVLEAWRNGVVYRQHWNKDDFINYGKAMVEQGQVKDLKTYQGDAEAPESLHLHFIPFRQGLLYVGTLQIPDNEQIDLLTMLARTFAIAYARYEDFVKLEQAKAEVESALGELKATQVQLVQQEKLASLGQLTAGIAHEIKNPLNFVNNFSEVSLELLEESLEELEREPGMRDESLLKENFDHIRSNIKKVLDHGYRANGIVTSMLMHSRGGTGKAEPVPLNEFIKEYASLAYHGMRAGKSPVDVRLIFETDEKIQQVPLIAEDFSRVVLNICHNAFDALKNTPSPSVTIRTLAQHDSVCIQFEDNGPGIDAAIKDKVFQPFFTTKKGKEGTGLGLSISHDIVKTHGGTIRVETGAGKGTIFIISLPIQKAGI